MSETEPLTYRDIQHKISQLTEDQLDMTFIVYDAHVDESYPVESFMTVKDLYEIGGVNMDDVHGPDHPIACINEG